MVRKYHNNGRDVAISMHWSGLSCRTLQNYVCIPKSTIHDWIEKIEDTKGSHERLSGSGRPRVSSSTDDQHDIILEVKRNRLITTDEILSKMPTVKRSKQTIRLRIKESGEFNSYSGSRL